MPEEHEQIFNVYATLESHVPDLDMRRWLHEVLGGLLQPDLEARFTVEELAPTLC